MLDYLHVAAGITAGRVGGAALRQAGGSAGGGGGPCQVGGVRYHQVLRGGFGWAGELA
jgi:hypothetical protein